MSVLAAAIVGAAVGAGGLTVMVVWPWLREWLGLPRR